MNSASRQWALAPSILSLIWGGAFLSVDYQSVTHAWWNPFVLSLEQSPLCSFTTTFFHANLAHVLSNIALAYILSYGLRELFRPNQFLAFWLIVAPMATLVSFLITPGALVGASAGLMGVLGGALALALNDASKRSPKWLTVVCVAVLVFCAPGDRIAHLSGFFLGYGCSRRIVATDVALQSAGLVTAGAFGWILMMN